MYNGPMMPVSPAIAARPIPTIVTQPIAVDLKKTGKIGSIPVAVGVSCASSTVLSMIGCITAAITTGQTGSAYYGVSFLSAGMAYGCGSVAFISSLIGTGLVISEVMDCYRQAPQDRREQNPETQRLITGTE
jgi:hypothetical protein